MYADKERVQWVDSSIEQSFSPKRRKYGCVLAGEERDERGVSYQQTYSMCSGFWVLSSLPGHVVWSHLYIIYLHVLQKDNTIEAKD